LRLEAERLEAERLEAERVAEAERREVVMRQEAKRAAEAARRVKAEKAAESDRCRRAKENRLAVENLKQIKSKTSEEVREEVPDIQIVEEVRAQVKAVPRSAGGSEKMAGSQPHPRPPGSAKDIKSLGPARSKLSYFLSAPQFGPEVIILPPRSNEDRVLFGILANKGLIIKAPKDSKLRQQSHFSFRRGPEVKRPGKVVDPPAIRN
jgi:hypothetical protein